MRLSSILFIVAALAVGLTSNAFIITPRDLLEAGKTATNEATETIYLDLNVDQPGQESCTGVVVSPNLILTAGHCLQMLGSATRVGISSGLSNRADQFGDRARYSHRGQVTVIDIAKKAIHPQYIKTQSDGKKESSNIQYDLGYIMTNTNLRKIFPRIQFPQILADQNIIGNMIQQGSLVTAGYGISFPGPEGSSTVNVFKLKLNLSLDGISADNYYITRSLEQGRGPCEGDSGSGLFIKSGEVRSLIGILSGVASNTGKPLPRNQCGSAEERAAYLILAPHLRWLQSETGIQLWSPHVLLNVEAT
jgi:hypothetical protein